MVMGKHVRSSTSTQLLTNYDDVEMGCLFKGQHRHEGINIYAFDEEDDCYYLIAEHQRIFTYLNSQAGRWRPYVDSNIRVKQIEPSCVKDWEIVTKQVAAAIMETVQ